MCAATAPVSEATRRDRTRPVKLFASVGTGVADSSRNTFTGLISLATRRVTRQYIRMTHTLPLGHEVDPRPARRPDRVALAGRDVDVVPLDPAAHGDALFEGTAGPANDALWTYLFDGPFRDRPSFDRALERNATSDDPLFFAIVDRASRRATGQAAFMRIEPTHRVIEVGSILYTDALQRTRGATEAMYLMGRYVFDELQYRRYEWKCNALNAASRTAALRLGFTFEGVFRQHMIVKGRSRDTAWYSMLDAEWPARKAAFERWLSPDNFDAARRQKTALSGQDLAKEPRRGIRRKPKRLHSATGVPPDVCSEAGCSNRTLSRRASPP